MSDTATPQAPASKPAGKGTSYLVLEETLDGTWSDAGYFTATSAEAAIREAAANDGNPGTFVAVPARSWKPVRVKVETVSRVRLEDA